MSLDQATAEKIKGLLRGGQSLDRILQSSFPDLQVSIVRGYDRLDEVAYVQSAHFSFEAARRKVSGTKPNGDEYSSDTFSIVSGTVRQLSEGTIRDPRSMEYLDRIDRQLAYAYLEQELG